MKKVTLRRWLAAFAGASLLLGTGWLWWYLHSPAWVARQALGALEAQDSAALCRLADPEELKTLNLTPEKVDHILRDTLWSTEFPQTRHHVVNEFVSIRPDTKGYAIYPRHISVQPPNHPHPKNFWLICLQNPDGSWHLNLGHVITDACYNKTGGLDGGKLYYRYAVQYGINGSHSQNGPYMSMAEVRDVLRHIFPKEADRWPE